MPVMKTTHRRALGLCLVSIVLVAAHLGWPAVGTRAQGFGLSKKTVKLQRKMPATVHLPGAGFDVQVNAHDSSNADAARMLTDLLTT